MLTTIDLKVYFISNDYLLDNGRFYTRGRIIRLDELGQTLVVRLVIHLLLKTGTRRIMHLEELTSVVRQTTEDSSS